jgi:uncharacterized Rmd1/YagE family protein
VVVPDVATQSRVRDVPLCGVALDGRVTMRAVAGVLPWTIVRQSSLAVTCRLPDSTLLHIFAMGAVVLERADLVGDMLATVEAATSRRVLAATRERYAVRLEPTQSEPFVDWDHVVVADADESTMLAVALVLAQSVALERYERGAEAILDESLALTRELGQRGRPPWRRGLPVRRAANLAADRLELARWFFLLDRPEATWDDRRTARLHDLLFAHFELRERFEALMHKLASVQSTLEVIIDLWQSRRSRLLEWAIIALIAFEIALALLEMG